MRYGRLFTPGTDAGGGYPMIPARAGKNAYRRAVESGLLYAEGYARRPPGITHYSAWCLDRRFRAHGDQLPGACECVQIGQFGM